MYRTKTAWLAAVLACALGGCGTIGNLTDPSRTKPFGGVMRDGEASSWLMNEFSEASKKPTVEKAGLVLAAPIVTVDLPLSLVADTVTLPITIPIALMRQQQPEPLREPGPRKPTTPNENENASPGPTAVSNYVPCVPLSGAARP
ncbi:MAG TPA: YceK/YidQ family lipoprotein [Gemmataceae bacterium]|jgi:uncharacterized protein YceK